LNSVSAKLTGACSQEPLVKFDRLRAYGFAVALSVALTIAPDARAIPQILVDETTGRVIAENEADALWHPASLTKMMTAYLAFKAISEGRLSSQSVVVMSTNAVSKAPSKLGLPVGHGLTLSDALKITLTRSMNDVATAIGEKVAAGDEPTFVRLMNQEAKRLGMLSTHFTNASGLPDPLQVTTARDFAILATALSRDFPQFDGYFQIESVSYGKKTFTNTNSLLKKFPGVTGMKTGYVCSSGYNLVNRVIINNHRYISVVMGAANGRERERLTVALLGLIPKSGEGYPLQSVLAKTKTAINLKKYACGKSYTVGKTTPKPAGYPVSVPAVAYTYEYLGDSSF
jgi:D-alanyl-D-alanine carboxypeptidase